MIKRSDNVIIKDNSVILANKNTEFNSSWFTLPEIEFIKKQIERKTNVVEINRYEYFIYICIIDLDKEINKLSENVRILASRIHKSLVAQKTSEICILDTNLNPDLLLKFAEGLALSNYQFISYFKDKTDRQYALKTIFLSIDKKYINQIQELNILVDAVYKTRNMVNEPYSAMNAVQLSDEFRTLGEESGFSIDVFDKKKIEALRMGGLLSVNQGSVDPPTFSVMEWKAKKTINKQPIILVGKGVVFDTGGLSLKPTAKSMSFMKCDMAGGAVVGGVLYALAKAKIPVHVIGIVPATDNRPGGNAFTPGEIVKMFNGLHVEMLNADAEGRMILADALSYAKKYNPELVIDLATLTGAAVGAIGQIAAVSMGNASDEIFSLLENSGNKTYERNFRFPFWEEYESSLKSDVADLKNIGGENAGAITAGKFLERFTDYPWIHMDIAGPSFLNAADGYRTGGGTGYGVRLLFDFIKNWKSN